VNKILLVGTSFARNGEGVPDMNYTFREYLSQLINIDSLDIYETLNHSFPGMNKVLARNLFLFKSKQFIEKKFIHVMHPNDLCGTVPLINFSKYSKRKIVTVHDFYPFIKKFDRSFYSRIDNFSKRKCFDFLPTYDHIFARTNEISKRLEDRYCIDKEKITVQGPIIEERYFSSKLNDKKNSKVVIGYVNNFNWNKSRMLLRFIETFKKVRSMGLELHIYGSGFPYEDQIKDDQRIKYYGFLQESEAAKVMANFDVYLSTSEFEGFGIPIAKAKAMKIPVLCFNGDIPKITKGNTCLWDQHNLKYIIENEEWRNIDLIKAYKDVLCLRPESIVKQTIEIYEKVFS
jgi:hypothetical protein